MIAYLTEHSSQRLKERLGIPKRAHSRMAKVAMKRGMDPKSAPGEFGMWMDSVAQKSAESDQKLGNVILRIHGHDLYIFRRRRHTRRTPMRCCLLF